MGLWEEKGGGGCEGPWRLDGGAGRQGEELMGFGGVFCVRCLWVEAGEESGGARVLG